jgi:hypothetical protein
MAAFAAVAANAQAATTQSGTTLSSTQSITFSGTIEPDPVFGVENPLGPSSATCQLGVPCETVEFSVATSGDAVLTLFSDNPNNLLDVTVECGMLVEVFRGAGGTDPVTGSATVTFPVTAGETCTVFISVFLAEDAFAPVPFHGSITLGVVAGVEQVPGHVTGGGQAMTLVKSPFTSNAQEKEDGTGQGKVRYFVGDNCKFDASDIRDVTITDGTATITGFGRLNVGNGWSPADVPFVATVRDVDHSMDEFQIDKCGGNADGLTIASGQITIH